VAPQQEDNGLEAVLRGAVAHFDFDRDQLKPDGQEKLRQVADALRTHPKAHVRISGYCDELGTEEYNLALGQRRAEVARKYLVALGVSPGQVDTVSFGKEKPADPGHNDDAHAANRRDEVEPRN
jgi:peptidoglycan-associated lipoprotein